MAWDTSTWVTAAVTSAQMNARIRDNFKEIGDARSSYVPTLTGWTLSNGTLTGTYIEAGKLIIGTLDYTVGSADTKSGNPTFSLPVTSINSVGPPIGTGSLFDTSASARGHRNLFLTSTTTFQFAMQDDTRISPTAPWTWATGDRMWAQFVYEAA